MLPANAVLADALAGDPAVVLFATSQPEVWVEQFGADRIRTFPITEATMVGAGIGAAVAGLRPVLHLGHASFTFVAMDQLLNQAGKLGFMSGHQLAVPMLVRVATRGIPEGLGAQHEVWPYALFAHSPGWVVGVPGTLEHAAGFMKAALAWRGPVAMFENPLMWLDGYEGSHHDIEPIPFGQARSVRHGDDVTIVALGGAVPLALEVAGVLAAEGVSAGVLDPVTAYPLDVATIRREAARTGRCVVVDEAPAFASLSSEIAACLLEDGEAWRRLEAPVARVCARKVPSPYAPALQEGVRPTADRLLGAVRRLLA